jgi:ATP-dependent RNA helicase SUPV3L1/SUV3
VAARAERFVNYQIESLLKPLIDLANAEQLSGMARGIAFRLVENFGLLNRRDVAADVKALDQEARAALRRLGVRFGAYHIFVPALVKPGPAGLLTLLWALKNDGKDRPGFGDVVQLLAAGRTSVVTDPQFDPAFYRLAGFRVLGRRAVRVDILERLADLIRPALAWKAGTGARPDGAFDGNAFTVTPAMMSILGAKAEDMEEILKGLGYRAEARPAAEVTARLEAIDRAQREAAEAAAAKAAAEAKAAEAAREEAQTTTESSQPEPQAIAEGTQPEPLQRDEGAGPETQATAPTDEASAETPSETAETVTDQTAQPVQTADDEAAAEHAGTLASPSMGEVAERSEAGGGEISEAAPSQSAADAQAKAGLDESAPTELGPGGGDEAATAEEPVAPEANAETEEPKPILLWRPARFERGPRHHRERGKDHRRPGGAEANVSRREDNAQGRRFDRQGKPGRFEAAGEGQDRDGHRKGRHEGPHKGPHKSPHKGPQRGKPSFQPKPREERPPRFDPDSPFAKLAALRDQLKK